jgi:protein-tyrosine phosphatase
MEIVDFHAHVLPHMDHGSTRTETGKDQLALIHAAGVHTVCATSHFYPQDILPSVFLEQRQESLARLLKTYGDAPRPRIILGAEVLICPGIQEMEGLEELCLEGSNILLLEMPFTKSGWDRSLFRAAYEIMGRGIRPVLAHVDRYPEPLIEEMFDMGLCGQINAVSMVKGLFKPRHLLRWIEEGRIKAFGSDLHGRDPRTYAPFTKLQKQYPDVFSSVMASTAELLKDVKRH